MKARKIAVIVSLFISVALIALYCSVFYHYETVLVFPSSPENSVPLYAASNISTSLEFAGDSGFVAYTIFEFGKDTVTMQNLNVTMLNADTPGNKLSPLGVIKFNDTDIIVHEENVRANTFSQLPDQYKIITPRRETRSNISFLFNNHNAHNNGNYLLKITGSAIHNGKSIPFSKDIKVICKSAWVHTSFHC